MRSKVTPKKTNNNTSTVIDTTATISSSDSSTSISSSPSITQQYEESSPATSNDYADKYNLKECKVLLNRDEVDDYYFMMRNKRSRRKVNDSERSTPETISSAEKADLNHKTNAQTTTPTTKTHRNGLSKTQKLNKIKLFLSDQVFKNKQRKNSIDSESDAYSSLSSASDESSSSSSVFATASNTTNTFVADQSPSINSKTSPKYDDLIKKYSIAECEVVLSRIDPNTLHNKKRIFKQNENVDRVPKKRGIELKECKVLVEKLDEKTIEKYNKPKTPNKKVAKSSDGSSGSDSGGKYNTRATRRSAKKLDDSTIELGSSFNDETESTPSSIITLDATDNE